MRVHAGRLRFARRQAVMAPDAFRRHIVIGGQIFCALAGGDDAETGGARPVDHFGGQRRLIAVSERIDHARLPRLLGEQRPASTSASWAWVRPRSSSVLRNGFGVKVISRRRTTVRTLRIQSCSGFGA